MAIERTDDHLLTVPEAAERLRVHVITVRRYIKAGRLAAVRVGRNVRVRTSALEAFIGGASDERPLTLEKRERQRLMVMEMRRLRNAMPPLGISTAELIRQGREDLERH